MAERTGDRNSPLANMVLRWMAYNQPGLTDKQMDACLAGADALEEVERLRGEIERLKTQLRQEPCEDCYERCCGAGDQCPCHMRPWDTLDQTPPEEVEDG